MNDLKLEVVETPRQRKEFLDLPKRLYADNRYWVCPLDDDIEVRFDPARNELFENGEAIRWIVRDGAGRDNSGRDGSGGNNAGRVVGRIAAFYNRDSAAINEQPTGGCGFFESIDDQRVADMLFDAARDWLRERGMEAMDGPVNFGDRDSWWGLLLEGYELQPLYQTNYNPPYYKELFEKYGFQNYFNQYTYLRNLRIGEFSASVYDRVKRLEETPGYRFEHIAGKELDQVADDFRMIYNKAWATHAGVKPMDREHTRKMMQKIKPVMDKKLIYFAYFNDEPIGFFIMLPDTNRVIGPLKGKMNWLGALRTLFMLKYSSKADRIMGMTFGVVPEFQGKGVESGMIHGFEKELARMKKTRYKSLELVWIGDFNPVMMRVVENYVCARKHKTHATYRYLFDREKPFTRCPRIGGARRNR